MDTTVPLGDRLEATGRTCVNDYFDEATEFSNLFEPLIKALEWPGEYRNMIEALPHFSKKMDLTSFRNTMVRMGYQSEAIEVPFKAIQKQLMPCLYVPYNAPAMLLLSKDDDYFKIMNGLNGQIQRVRALDVEGIVYMFKPVEDDKRKLIKRGWFVQHFSRYRMLMVQILVISYFLNIFVLASPIFVMSIYDKVIGADSVPMLITFSIGVLLVMIGSEYLSSLRAGILSHIGARLDKSVGGTIVERLLYLPPSFTENATVGAQLARLKEFDRVREFFTSPLATMMFESPFVFVFLITVWILGGSLILVPLIMMLVYVILYVVANPVMQKAIARSAEETSKKQSFQVEALSNIREIKSTNVETEWLNRFKKVTAEATYTGVKASLITLIVNSVSEWLMMISGLAVLGFGAVLVMSKDMTTGGLIATMMITWRLLAPLKMIFSILPRFRQMFSLIAKLDTLMDMPLEREPNKFIVPLKGQKGLVEFSRVSFRYRPDTPPALIGVSFKVEPGQMLCIAGRNGSGKSTLIKMIAALYQPQAGMITIDGANIQQMDKIELRHSVAYMPQNTKLFFGTIEQNLLMGHPVATREEMIKATKLAGIYEYICTLPEGFQTHLRDQSSVALSSSFQQKLSLARTYIRNAVIYIFDEPANSLDEAGDHQFMRAVKELSLKSTVIIVTHRPAHLKMADKILYLNQGELVLQGAPSQVLEKIPFEYL